MKIIKAIKQNFEFLFLICGWIIIWASIGITPDYLINFNFTFSWQMINFIRGIAPIFYFFSLIFYYFFFYKQKFNFKDNPVLILMTIYFVLQIFSAYLAKDTLNDIYYILLGFLTIILISLKNSDRSDNIYFKNISIFFIFILFLNFVFPQFKSFLHTPLSFYQQWGIGSERNTIISLLEIDFAYPNILGFSRYVLVLIIFLFFLKKKNLVTNTFICILASILFLLQARATLLIYILFVLLHPIIFEKINLKIYLKKIILLIFIPIIIFSSINFLKINYFFKKELVLRNNAEVEYFNKNGTLFFRPLNKGNFSSDRFQDWENMIKGNIANFWGSGPQSDRKFYNKTASNGWVYAFICSGYLGFFTLLALSCYSALISLKYSLLIRRKSINYSLLYHPSICLIFLARTFFETSIGVFGIDFILFFYSLIFMQKYYKNEI